MQFKLLIDEKEKTFYAPFIKGRILRRALQINNTLNGGDLGVEALDELVSFVCEVFNNQFTPDDVWDGMELEGMFSKLQEVFIEVVNRATSGIQGVSNPKNI
jgi:hypothetical protein